MIIFVCAIRPMNYQETLKYLFSQLPMYQRDGKSAFKKDLKNIKLLCKHFGNPQHAYDKIHIAGTNGKGTVAHLLAAVFQQSGLKVGIYTSPHYKDFRERIKVNGNYINKRQVSAFTKKVIDQIDAIKPSFFEITVAMAFDHFKREKVDLAIIETGLGGRLDSTNIITPKLSVITNISLDHQSMLGNTIRKIAKEKAGIIKKEVPVVIGERQDVSEEVFMKVAKKKASKIWFAADFRTKKIARLETQKLSDPYLPINTKTARAAIQVWNIEKLGVHVSLKNLQKGILNFKSIAGYIGRWHVLQNKPLVIADSAHNEGGVSLLIQQCLAIKKPKQLHFVIGFVKDKSLEKILSLFPKGASYYFCKAKIARALSASSLAQEAKEVGLEGRAYKSVKTALAAAKRKANLDESVIVCGSIFVVAETL